MTNTFTRTYTALPEHIDELGHVNNTVWVQWIQTPKYQIQKNKKENIQ